MGLKLMFNGYGNWLYLAHGFMGITMRPVLARKGWPALAQGLARGHMKPCDLAKGARAQEGAKPVYNYIYSLKVGFLTTFGFLIIN
jgi:hypothetical protein